MKKLKLFFACLLMTVLSIGQVWAAEELKATIDFSSNDFSIPTSKTVAENTYTHDGISMTLTGTSGNGYAYYSKDKYLLNGKQGATITFSAFEWKTTKIVVTGRSGASGSTKMNIFVGENAVSTETTGSTGTNTYNIASTSQAAGTIYTLKVTSAHNAQFTKFEIYGEDAGTPVKTLTSIAVSGTPTKTSYESGENFDPAGLTVTGTYSDNSQATITSGITWSYNPAQTLALNQTSIGVTASVSNITSEEYAVGITVAAAPAAVEYALFSGDIEEGDYVIYYGGKVVKNVVASNRLSYDEVTPVNDKIKNPSAAIVWHIAPAETEGYWTLYSADVQKYVVCTTSNNQANLNASATANAVISVSEVSEGSYEILSKARKDASSNNYYLRNNGTYGFAFYSSSTGGALSLYRKVDSSEKPSAEIAYAEADKKKLTKLGETFTAPTLVNPHGVAVTYASSAESVAEVAANGAVTIKAAGVATITASFAGNENFKSGSASYTIGVTTHAGTEVDPYDVADAKIVIDAVGTKENAYVSGIVSSIYSTALGNGGVISFYISADGATNGLQLEAYKCLSLNSEAFSALSDVETGATVVITGTLKKYNSTYELDANCHLVSYEAPEQPKQSIANTQESAYTVAQALIYAADGMTYDLNDEVYVQGKVAVASSSLFNNKYLTYFISDNGVNENTLKIYNGLSFDGASFGSKDDIKVGDIVIVKGKLTEYNNVLELNQNNKLVLLKPVASITVENMEIAIGEEPKAIVADINPAAAAENVVYSLAEGSDAYISIDAENKISAIAEGVATVNVTIADGDTYAGASTSFTVTVNAAAPVALTDYYEKVTSGEVAEGTYLIVYEDISVAFNGGLETLDAASNTIDVEITNDHKIGVTPATEAATFYIDPAAGTIQAANGKYIGVTSNSNGLKTSDNANAYAHTFSIDADGNAVIAAVFDQSSMTLRYNTGSNQNRFRYYGSGQQAIQLYKLANEAIKPVAGLAWDPAEDITLTVGDALTAPTLLNPNNIDAAEISIESSNTGLATVTAGEVALVADATGTTTITATFAGNDNFKPATVSYKITVNPAHSIYVSPGLNVNFGSVQKDATVDDKVITVTLTEVAAATLTLAGDGASAFSIDPTAAMTQSGDITISASSATAGTFAATLTISDDAGEAASKVVNLSLTVVDPATVETAISTTSEWVPATEIVDGMQVLITGVASEVVYAMGEQKSTNRAAYVATLNEGVLTPGEGTMAFTLVAQGDGTYAIRTSNGKYLYAAKNDANHLKTQDEVDVNAKWTLTIESAVAEGSTNRNIMRFNSGSSKLFSCYSSGQQPIKFYVPKQDTPEPPTPDYGEYTRDVQANSYGTICLPKAGQMVSENVTLYEISYKESNDAVIYLDEVLNGAMEAGMPYIFFSAVAQVKVEYTANESAAAQHKNGLYGTLENMNNMSGAGIYMIYQNQLRHSTSSASYLDANRAYIMLGEVSTEAQPKQSNRRRVAMGVQGEQVATGIDALNASDKPAKMIINGQLFIIRGEKMYNVNGQLVK